MRTGQQQDTNANSTATQNSNQAVANENQDITQFTNNESTLANGGQVGADPWLSPSYVSSQNRLTSDALNANNNAGEAQLRGLNRRTGGFNTGATTAGIAGLKMNTGRLANSLDAQRSAEDFNKNIAYQQYLAGLPLQAAGAEQGIYNTGVGEVNSSDQALTQLGTASYGPWNQLIGALGQAGSAAVRGAFPGTPGGGGGGGGGGSCCWVATSFYGVESAQVKVIRHWLHTKAPVWFRDFYIKHGPWIAKTPLRWLFKPLFEHVLIENGFYEKEGACQA